MKMLFAAAAALLPCAAVAADLPSRTSPAPVFASAPAIDAFGSVSLGYHDWKVSGPSADGANIQARATFQATLSGAIGFQADGEFEHAKFSAGSNDLVNNTGSLTGHLFWRDSNLGLLGVIAQGSAKNSSFLSDRNYFIGVEAQYFLGDVTLYGQAAYQDYSLGAGTNLDASGVALASQLRYFVSPNLMLALKGGYSDVRLDVASYDHTAWLVGAKAEYRLSASPISVFAEGDYRHGKVTGNNLITVNETEQRFMVGAKWNFGSQTLIQRDRSGASLDPIRSLMPATLPNIEPR